MSHRQQQKAAMREARVAAERVASARDARRKRAIRLAAALAVAAVFVVVLAGRGADGGDEPDGVEGVADSRAMLEGIPQNGMSLGHPGAPVVLTEFADVQCPFCRDYTLHVLPQLIERYVRPGRMRLELRLLRFIGPDSDRGARVAVAASRQHRMWNFVDLFYRNQGREGSGYADDEFLRGLARAAGMPGDAAIDALTDQRTEPPLARAQQEASAAGIQSTPSFLVSRRGGRPRPLEAELTFDAFERALEPFLAR